MDFQAPYFWLMLALFVLAAALGYATLWGNKRRTPAEKAATRAQWGKEEHKL